MAPKKKAAAKPEAKAGAQKEDDSEAALAMAALPKCKAQAKSLLEPPFKRLKKDDAEDTPELEKDAPRDGRATLKEPILFHPADITLNVVPTMGGRVLMSLSEGGMQYLIAGARANVGMKAGRYLFEVKIVEALNPAESSAGGTRGRAPAPRQLVRLGFSTAGSALVLGTSDEHVAFDSEGNFWSGKKKSLTAQRLTRDQIISVLLNLDPKSPNANTISLFRDGQRLSEPQALPEAMQGRTLFPHVSFRNVTVQIMSSPTAVKTLPFKCRSLWGAAQADVEVTPGVVPKDGYYDVLFPVALPDEGTFDWLDSFMARNPNYVELSDRKILEWAQSSGLWKPKATGFKTSNDKPEFNFGLPGMDDLSVRRVLRAVAPTIPRNYVVMEVKSNLIESERRETIQKFAAPHFRKTARVVMGEPSQEFKQVQLDKLLEEKQAKADIAWRAKKAEVQRKRDIERRQKELADIRKRADDARKKAAEEARKRAEEAKRKAEEEQKEAKRKLEEAKARAKEGGDEEAKPDGGDSTEAGEEAAKMEVDEGAGAAEEEEKKEEPEEEREEEKEPEEELEPPKVELTPEEQQKWFRPSGGVSDLTASVLSQFFGNFSVPDDGEGFDSIEFEWQDAATSREYLRNWVLDKKRTSRIENLQPGSWFQEKFKEWLKAFSEWQAKQKSWKAELAKKKKEREAAKKKKEEGDEEADGKDDEEEGDDEDVPAVDVDIFAVADVCDVGNGEPLFKDFGVEDWALLQIRFELYTLQLAFRKDVDDPERLGISDAHLPFYYQKYFKKTLTPKHFGVTSNIEVTRLVKDVVSWDEENGVLSSPLTEEIEDIAHFMKLTEENRRERQRRIDAGDETARLKFSPLALQTTTISKAAAAPPASGIRPSGSWSGAAGMPKQWARPAGGAIFPSAAFRPPTGTTWAAVGGWGGSRRW